MEKLHEMDDTFRKQLESMLAAHQEELLQLANEKEKQIEAANEKVILHLYVYCVCIFSLWLPQQWCLKSPVCIYLANLWMEADLV